ncbi:hypothetical protein LCGC14_0664170 [marine sediment metagenome]|uniref:Uncharacterized protein n=1 Tax=marine sediment metagenome TaxID=412755 RepID=A0A0F9RCW8_9ZZZZ
MASCGRLTDERARAIARAYCSNGYDKTNGLRSVVKDDGTQYYSESYCISLGHKLYSNIRVKAEIDRIMADNRAENKLTVQQVLDDLDDGLQKAKTKQDLNAIARFCELRGKHLAMFTDRHIDVTDAIAPELSPEDQEKVRAALIRLVPGGRKDIA